MTDTDTAPHPAYVAWDAALDAAQVARQQAADACDEHDRAQAFSGAHLEWLARDAVRALGLYGYTSGLADQAAAAVTAARAWPAAR